MVGERLLSAMAKAQSSPLRYGDVVHRVGAPEEREMVICVNGEDVTLVIVDMIDSYTGYITCRARSTLILVERAQ